MIEPKILKQINNQRRKTEKEKEKNDRKKWKMGKNQTKKFL